ncbi:MAG: B12-binding domain-containing radical SAM protein [Magnetococcus sp. YQC-5]
MFNQSEHEVVLVNAPADKIREEIYDRPSYPCISIAYLGAYLEKHAGITPALVDGKLARLSADQTMDTILSFKPKMVGFTAFTHMIHTVSRLATRLKQQQPDLILVLGGFHASFLPKETLIEFPVFDYLVVGEGEIAFSKLVQYLLNGSVEPRIPGVWYKNNELIVEGGRGEITPDLDDFSEPGWHLYEQEIIKNYVDYFPVITQRGCPFHCNFCSRPYGRHVRKRSPALVVDEIEKNLSVYVKHKFTFYDETFTVNKKHVEEICQKIIDRQLLCDWTSMVHANTIDEHVVQLMKHAGCREVGIGVESGNQEIMAAMQKGITLEKIAIAFKIFKKIKIGNGAFFIIGHPNETFQSCLDTIRFAGKLNADRTVFGIMVPYPGTEVFNMAVQGTHGYKKLSTNWDDYNKQIGNAIELEHLSRRTMETFQTVGYLYVYLVNFRFVQLGSLLWKQKIRVYNVLKKIITGRL